MAAANPFAGIVIPTPSPIFQEQNYLQGSTQFQKIIITTAQLLALNTTPVIIAPAAGPSTILVQGSLTLRYIAGNTAFTIGTGVLKLYLGAVSAGHAVTANVATGLIDQTVNKSIPYVQFVNPTTFDTDANFVNQPFQIGNDVANFTLGNGQLEVMFSYNTFQV